MQISKDKKNIIEEISENSSYHSRGSYFFASVSSIPTNLDIVYESTPYLNKNWQ